MRIVLDAMGSDRAPSVDVEGGVRAARRFGAPNAESGRPGVEIILVGRRDEVERELARHETEGLPISIVHASQVVGMAEPPSRAVRAKPDASMVVGIKLLRDREADAFVSMGNSGGILAACLASVGRIGRIEGIHRPAISTVLPAPTGFGFMLDIGANADCKPEWLVQFAVMGAAYVRSVLGIANPRVGLLSNGEEDTKGSQVVQDAHAMLRRLDLNFVGNVEGKDIVSGMADVIVADGFAGNVAVKTAEGVASMLMSALRDEIKARPLAMLGGLLAKPAFRAVAKMLDYREYGGAALLGVNGIVIIGHGRSEALAVENAVRVAIDANVGGLIPEIRQDIKNASHVLGSVPPPDQADRADQADQADQAE